VDRLERGSARLREFQEFLGDTILYLRAMLITRSVYYALVRFQGWEPWAWRPYHVAASILAVPIGQEVPDHLGKRSSWMVDEPLRRPTGKGQIARLASNPELHKLWVQNQFCALALGAPDGMPLRIEMANGNWAGAIEHTMDRSPLREDAIVNVPVARRWHELLDEFIRPIPFDMTEEEARRAPPPWQQWIQWDWSPPVKYSLEQRLELARHTTSCHLFVEDLLRQDDERRLDTEEHNGDREELA
jgi:hypothetical protein